MNSVDGLVRDLMLRYPTLYPNRFEALADVYTNSCFHWNEDGCLVSVSAPEKEPATAESMLALFAGNLAKVNAKYRDDCAPCLRPLHARFRLEAELALCRARLVAANIDLCASEYVGVGYQQVHAWLHWQHRYGSAGDYKYWSVANPPARVAPEWRAAVCAWFQVIMPPMHGLMGVHEEATGWHALSQYARVFNWVKDTYKRYETEEARRGVE